MNVSFESPKPEIRIYFDLGGGGEGAVREIALGIEEENVPYNIKEEKDTTNAVVLGYKAAQASHLGVGIGVNRNEIALHFNKLNEDEPLFRIPFTTNQEKLRAVGSNAARLVKRMPFKEL